MPGGKKKGAGSPACVRNRVNPLETARWPGRSQEELGGVGRNTNKAKKTCLFDWEVTGGARRSACVRNRRNPLEAPDALGGARRKKQSYLIFELIFVRLNCRFTFRLNKEILRK